MALADNKRCSHGSWMRKGPLIRACFCQYQEVERLLHWRTHPRRLVTRGERCAVNTRTLALTVSGWLSRASANTPSYAERRVWQYRDAKARKEDAYASDIYLG